MPGGGGTSPSRPVYADTVGGISGGTWASPLPPGANFGSAYTMFSGLADFAALAKDKSQDPGSAAEGGDLGCISPGETVEPFDRTSFAAPLNQPQLVQSEYGWHVLVTTRRTDAGVVVDWDDEAAGAVFEALRTGETESLRAVAQAQQPLG